MVECNNKKQSTRMGGVVLIWLLSLTLLAALPVDPQGPFDARDYRPAAGVELDFPVTGALIEPLLAPGMALAGEPDVRIAAVSTLIWIIALTAGFVLYQGVRPEQRLRSVHLLRALQTAGFAGAVFIVYLCFVLLIPLPGWTLKVHDPDLIVTDLQTHTVYSRDGLVDPAHNLALHRARGFDVVAFTEHYSPAGALISSAYSHQEEAFPYAIVGTEVRDPKQAFLLSVGWLPEGERWTRQWLLDLETQPVIALAWKLSVADVRRLAPVVTGFEIANAGHPDIPQAVREAILDEAIKRNLVLVASSDWHGWSGFWRTWTTVRVPGGRQLSRAEQAQAVVEALQQRRSHDIQPVVAGYLGPPSLLQALFAPFSALMRYGMELSALRVTLWWLWGGLLLLLCWRLQNSGLNAVRIVLSALLSLFGAGLVIQGGRLLTLSLPGMAAGETLNEVGGWGVAVGGFSLFAAMFMVVREVRAWGRKNQTIG